MKVFDCQLGQWVGDTIYAMWQTKTIPSDFDSILHSGSVIELILEYNILSNFIS